MSIGTNLPVEGIEDLASKVKSQASSLSTTLNSLRSAIQRDPSFAGNAAQKYDEYIQQWDVNQKGLVEALDGAGNLLTQFASKLRELNESAASGFNV